MSARADRIGAICDGSPFTRAFHQTRARQNGYVGGEGVVRTANSLGESACGKPTRFLPNQQAEYRQTESAAPEPQVPLAHVAHP